MKATIGVFSYTIHRDPKYWEKPNEYIPDRFNEENKLNRHRFGWIPFSIGPRQCIGNNLAFMEMKVIIIRLLQSFYFKPDPHSLKPNIPFGNLVVNTHPKCSLLIEAR
jgi:cytochrome P450